MLRQLKGVFRSFENRKVKYVVIGGLAAIVHGVPRLTLDLDILIEATTENAQTLLQALLEAGCGTAALIAPDELLRNEITSFRDFVSIDVQTSTPGLQFADAWSNRKTVDVEGQFFQVVCVEDLIAAKSAAGRPVDLEDVRLLRQE